ncbi:DsbC family protein [Sphaerotilus sp.]|uniref:DsbC family protein n=1 Tax=Sphaerotilus sp. TaxID=2093942 RepID=UPI002ACE296F|nr:DsbC family protein [Sphaerotilus sp.]MDZ7855767.1 DsbC family protein [Sphaerotilus sp.]
MGSRSLIALVATGLATAAYADEAAVRATVQRLFPNAEAPTVASTPIPGLLEAAVDGQVFYVTEDGRYLLGGPLVDVRAKRNLTDARLAQINRIAFDTLDTRLAISWVQGSGARKLAIFEDPDCPYCKALETTLKEIDDLTVYVFLYPIDQLHPEAAAKSRAVWCAPDRTKAWAEVMRAGVAPVGTANCADPIAEIAAFAKRHRINGTPTLVLADGTRLVGAVPRAQLEAELRRASKP